MSDNIKHPSHYAEGRNYEPKDVIRDWGLNFNLGSVVKYIARAGRKDDIVQDLKKAQQFIQFEIDAIEAERDEAPVPIEDAECYKYSGCGRCKARDKCYDAYSVNAVHCGNYYKADDGGKQ